MLQIPGLDELRRATAAYDRARHDYGMGRITASAMAVAKAAFDAATLASELDTAREKGKRAWQRAFGSHGPTVREVAVKRPECPYPTGPLSDAFWRGYYQDVRRVEP